ncbi:MAG: tail fiber domain-containing protein [Methylobacter sp.]
MDINKKNRSDLKSYFVKNSIPTESNFAELIDGMLNQKDDGIVKLSGDPLCIESAGDTTGLQKVINFYAKFQDANPSWSLQLNPRTDPNTPATAKTGFCVADGSGAARLFIDQNTGNIGVGVVNPNGKLDVAGQVRIGLVEGGSGVRSISFARDAGDEGNAGKIAYRGGFGQDALHIIGAGVANNARKIKLWDNTEVTDLTALGVITPSAGNSVSNGIMFKNNIGGDTTDSAWIRYYVRSAEQMTLEIGTANDDTDHIALMPSGNVGIGLNSPLYSLDVKASKGIKLGLEGAGGGQLILKNNKDDNKIYMEAFGKDGASSAAELLLTGMNAASVPKISLVADVTNITGNIGIGTDTPGARLDVEGGAFLGYETSLTDFGIPLKSGFYQGVDKIIGDVPDTSHSWSHLITGRHSNVANNHQLQIASTFASNDKLYFRKIAASNESSNPSWNEVATRGANVFSGNQLFTNGMIGIGTDNPTEAKLVVRGSANLTLNGYGYLNRNGASATNTTYTTPYSIYADQRIAAVEFNAHSDERIKSIQGLSSSATDLQTLLGIEITDYHYKDVIGKGSSPHKKVIAQQVEQVFSQAVSKHTDVVPDIYQQASFIDGWVELATDLKEGERVRLISGKAEGIYEVLEVAKGKFRTDFKPDEDNVFVFGREVNDFCNVDYDAIAMLNVSATQQIKKEMDTVVNALKADNAALKARLDALEAKIH